ncbi:MAG TPA: type II toxin-antitoxin system RelE/ParE family toxin [Terriglobia bacterium]|nr:type II toxin-antitoxin system RelE/ParE family toxin [Terriglobia bacterium]
MTVIWGKKAYDDLDQIVDYLADLSPNAAEEIISRIQKAVLTLSDFPNLGTKVDETGLRRLIVSDTPYVIFYRVLPDCVNVRAIFHTSQRRFLE